MAPDDAAEAFGEFARVIKALRTPQTGCPWDLEQDHHTLRPYLIEEAYEVLDAIESGGDDALREELGDLLLQVVLHAQVAADRGAFTITEVVRGITAKMVRRHPHVFGEVQVSGAAEVVRNWEQIKAAESREKGNDPSAAAALERLPEGLPALLRAQRLGEKAAKHHIEEPPLPPLLEQMHRELDGLEDADRQRALGDCLFGLCQIAHRLGLNAEEALRDSNRRFVKQVKETEAGER